jgi:hypothetical protein
MPGGFGGCAGSEVSANNQNGTKQEHCQFVRDDISGPVGSRDCAGLSENLAQKALLLRPYHPQIEVKQEVWNIAANEALISYEIYRTYNF